MAHLRLSFLGAFQASLDGREITSFEADKVRALLAYLAVEADRPHRRDALANLLWPEWSDRSARTSLRNALSNLRSAIEDRQASPPFLLITHETIQFNQESDHWLDIAAFNNYIKSDNLGDLEKGVNLNIGGFLEGFHLKDSPVFDEWHLLTRERIQRSASDALRRLISEYRNKGDFENATKYAWVLLEIEPWNEGGYQQLMVLLAQSGQRSAALAQFEVCRHQLHQGLGVEPSLETTSLYELIRDGEFDLSDVISFSEIPPEPGSPPYKGLQFFGEADSDLFFGREKLTSRLISKLDPSKGNRFLAVVGASGSGKTSIIRAGLVPALQLGHHPECDMKVPIDPSKLSIKIITPTAHPLESLAMCLAHRDDHYADITGLIDGMRSDACSLHLHVRCIFDPSSDHFLLVVDQFEELFTLCQDKGEREAFIDNLMVAVTSEGPTTIVIALRADFYAHCSNYANLCGALEKYQVYIGPMTYDELHQAVTEPARLGGWAFEPGLVEIMLQEIENEPGGLPLLSHALLETWQRRRGRTLTLAGYTEAGGVRGSIAQTADKVLDSLEPDQQSIARIIFLRLTELGETTQETRRRAKLDELLQVVEDRTSIEYVLKRLVDSRLVITSQDTAEVAHEALIREWPTLRSWLKEDQEGLRIHRHITEAAQEWERLERDQGELYRGARLATANEWFQRHTQILTPLEAEFLTASQQLADQEEQERETRRTAELAAAKRMAEVERQRAEEQSQAARSLRNRAWWLAGLTLITLILAGFALIARSNAQREADINHSLVLAASAQQAQENGTSDLALSLAMKAVDLEQPPSEVVRVLSDIALGPGTRALFLGHSGAVKAVAFHPDSNTALSGSCGMYDAAGHCSQGEMILWDLNTHGDISEKSGIALRHFVGHTDQINSITFSPDGQSAVSGSEDGTIILWSVDSGEIKRVLQGHTGSVKSLAFSPDGGYILSGSADASMLLWDVEKGEPIRSFEGHLGGVTCLAFRPDGLNVVSGSEDTSIKLWDINTGDEILQFEGHINQITGVAFSPDGSKLLSTADHSFRQWDLETGQELRQAMFGGNPSLFDISKDGHTAILDLGGLRLWDIGQWRESYWLLAGDSPDVVPMSARLSPDGRLGLTGLSDGRLHLWNLETQGQLRRFTTEGTPLSAVAINSDGKYLLTGDMSDVTLLWDIDRGEIIHRFEGKAIAVSPNSLAFSPDGKHALVGSGDAFGSTGVRSLVLYDLERGEEIRHFEGHQFVLRSVAISPDGRTALAGAQSQFSEEGELILWDLETGEQIRRLDTNEDISSIVFSKDGSRVLTGSAYFSNMTLWDINTGKQIRRFEGHTNMVFDVAFGPDERQALSASADGSIFLWDIETGEVIRRYLGHEDMVWSLDLSPDGQYIISSSGDATLILWDFETGEALHHFRGHTELVPDVVFSPDGKTVYSVSLDRALIAWRIADLSLDDLIDWINANRYLRELTCEERAQYRVEPYCEAPTKP